MSEVLDRHRDHRVIFEPLRPKTSTDLEAWWSTRYLAPRGATLAQITSMEALLDGDIRGPWMDHTNRTLLPRRRLIKEIEANCLVPWLTQTFPDVSVILLVRHPAAVVSSRIGLGWNDNLAILASDPALRRDFPFVQDICDIAGDNRYLRMVAKWTIETAIPLTTTTDNVCCVSYEELMSNPQETFGRVLPHVGQSPDTLLNTALEKRSRTSQLPSRKSGQEMASTVLTRLRAQQIIDRAGLRGLYRFASTSATPPDWTSVRDAVRASVC